MTAPRLAPWFVTATVISLLLWPARSAADEGVLLSPRKLAPPVRSALVARITIARATLPVAFERVARLRSSLDDLDAHKRGPLVVVAPRLKALGKNALLPMLEQLAVAAPAQGELSNSAWLAWRLGLLEATGSLREPTAEPVLKTLLDHPPRQRVLRRAAAVAYGKLGSDAAATRLIQLSRSSSPLRRAAIAGLGHCRRRIVAEHLASLLAERPARSDALLLARALGDVGSAWAWQTPTVARSGEQQAVRDTAAAALVDAFPSAGPGIRRMLTKAVLVVDHPATLQLIRQRRVGASSTEQAALARLAERVRESPLRR